MATINHSTRLETYLGSLYRVLVVHEYFKHMKVKVKQFGEKIHCGLDFIFKKHWRGW